MPLSHSGLYSGSKNSVPENIPHILKKWARSDNFFTKKNFDEQKDLILY